VPAKAFSKLAPARGRHKIANPKTKTNKPEACGEERWLRRRGKARQQNPDKTILRHPRPSATSVVGFLLATDGSQAF